MGLKTLRGSAWDDRPANTRRAWDAASGAVRTACPERRRDCTATTRYERAAGRVERAQPAGYFVQLAAAQRLVRLNLWDEAARVQLAEQALQCLRVFVDAGALRASLTTISLCYKWSEWAVSLCYTHRKHRL
jgi:hypothetical protein